MDHTNLIFARNSVNSFELSTAGATSCGKRNGISPVGVATVPCTVCTFLRGVRTWWIVWHICSFWMRLDTMASSARHPIRLENNKQDAPLNHDGSHLTGDLRNFVCCRRCKAMFKSIWQVCLCIVVDGLAFFAVAINQMRWKGLNPYTCPLERRHCNTQKNADILIWLNWKESATIRKLRLIVSESFALAIAKISFEQRTILILHQRRSISVWVECASSGDDPNQVKWLQWRAQGDHFICFSMLALCRWLCRFNKVRSKMT